MSGGRQTPADHGHPDPHAMIRTARYPRHDDPLGLTEYVMHALPDPPRDHVTRHSQSVPQPARMLIDTMSPYPTFGSSFKTAPADAGLGFGAIDAGQSHAVGDGTASSGNRERGSFSEVSHPHGSTTPMHSRRASMGSQAPANRMAGTKSTDASSAASPGSSREAETRHADEAIFHGDMSVDGIEDVGTENKELEGQRPPWSDLKTKAGKERKRLPLACIACRRKKIRCSGEKPACKHCLRSRIPCVYKVTARKAAPRTDYMAMLDKRLRRMEDRVIKTIPKDEGRDLAVIGRAVVKPAGPGHAAKAGAGKKRAADEAFGAELDAWSRADAIRTSRPRDDPPKLQNAEASGLLTEGVDCLPSKEIQEHLSEVFFDCVYGQSYHLLHKPSFMRKLR